MGKIVDAPEDLRPTPGDCNSNFFKIPQLYFEREACNYGIDMYKYDGIAEGLTPLDMPSAEDCQLKLGCCWEDDLEVMQNTHGFQDVTRDKEIHKELKKLIQSKSI